MDEILTTAKAAKLLGVSVRTAQLWVESGELASWKTPGGHRRIPRSAVMELVEKHKETTSSLSATAIVLAGKGRASSWQGHGLKQSGLLLEVTDDPVRAAVSIGESLPRLIVLDSVRESERASLIDRLDEDPLLSSSLIVVVSESPPFGPDAAKGGNRLYLPATTSVADVADTIGRRLRPAASATAKAEYAVPFNEAERLRAVEQSGLLYSPKERSFDRLVDLAAKVTNSPIALFTLLTADEQWFKARSGFEGDRSPREWAFCNYTIVANELTVLEDLGADERFADNPVLRQPYNFQFYAGAPVRNEKCFALGSICVIDRVPRSLDQSERDALSALAEAASNLVITRAQEREIRLLRTVN